MLCHPLGVSKWIVDRRSTPFDLDCLPPPGALYGTHPRPTVVQRCALQRLMSTFQNGTH